ncbi:sulfite exporter TauE/SafE family protein [Clostridium sp.]|uniref:urease accessory protein UreH domain-containing protein n=1 Tax=Clostridium sp. TaxID=1506 RepID=UPI003217D40C
MSIKSITLSVDNMVCSSCENTIEKKLEKIKGISMVKASYIKGTVYVKYDSSSCTYSTIVSTIEQSGYTAAETTNSNTNNSELLSIIGIVVIAFVIIRLGQSSGGFDMSSILSSRVSYIALFVIGVLTSIHCVGMCGGIMMSQSITSDLVPAKNKFIPSFLYNLGRLISYTVLGGIIGGIGKVFSISLGAQALIAIIAGSFMVIMGLNMFGFKIIRKLAIKLPWSSCNSNNSNKSPLIIGLLNGLMPCGPLQTMQLYALASGSIISGATSMFFFALGTIPLMLGFGMLTNLMSKKNSKKLIKLSGIIVIILGIIMANRGLSLMGFNLMPNSSFIGSNSNSTITQNSSSNKAVISDGKQIVRISATQSGYSPNVVYIQKDIPTEFIVDGESITFCNNQLVIPSMNIKQNLSSGENVIEFTPGDKDINYSCWMGMLTGTIRVVADLDDVDDNNINSENYYPSEGLPNNNGNFNGNFSCH